MQPSILVLIIHIKAFFCSRFLLPTFTRSRTLLFVGARPVDSARIRIHIIYIHVYIHAWGFKGVNDGPYLEVVITCGMWLHPYMEDNQPTRLLMANPSSAECKFMNNKLQQGIRPPTWTARRLLITSSVSWIVSWFALPPLALSFLCWPFLYYNIIACRDLTEKRSSCFLPRREIDAPSMSGMWKLNA